MLNGYKAFFKGKEIDVQAPSAYKAQLKAIEVFKPRRSQEHLVHVHICELAGTQVTHNTNENKPSG